MNDLDPITEDNLDFMYGLVWRLNHLIIKAERQGAGEADIEGIVDMVAKRIGLPKNYRDFANEEAINVNGLNEAFMETLFKDH